MSFATEDAGGSIGLFENQLGGVFFRHQQTTLSQGTLTAKGAKVAKEGQDTELACKDSRTKTICDNA
jgi:hypothetical protein